MAAGYDDRAPAMDSESAGRRPLILLTGATGYVGGRLLERLEAEGYPVRCLARRPEFLEPRVGVRTRVVAGDVLDYESLLRALDGVEVAYYLVHSMGAPRGFEDTDRRAAGLFAAAAARRGVARIIYLGGLGDSSGALSAHLHSRQEVGLLLARSGVPVIEFRASVIIGSGSLSFEMIRALVERLPVMITPRWVEVRTQPIAIQDVLDYLRAALDVPATGHTIYEIGGPEQVSYGGLMREYARQRGLRRVMIPVPVLTPRLSGLWLGLVTPLYARVGRKLIDSIRHPTLVRDDTALRAFPVRPVGVRRAIADALRREEREYAATRWSDALSSAGHAPQWGGVRFGNRLIDSRVVRVPVEPGAAFAPIRRIGGTNGWYYGDWIWRLRGWMDLLVGGVGMRRGRRDPEALRAGDVVDCWRVEHFEDGRSLRLVAEMRLPGRAWLTFEVTSEDGASLIRQTAVFDPVGLAGLAYWYLVYPLHKLVFAGMLRGIARAAQTGGGKR